MSIEPVKLSFEPNIILTLPDTTGTIALTTDLPTLVASDGLLDGTYNAGTFTFEPYAAAGAGHLSYTSAPVAGTTNLSYSGYFYTNRLNNMVILSTGGSRTLNLGGNLTTTTGNVTINAQSGGSTLNLPTSTTINTLKWQVPDRTNYFSSRMAYVHQLLIASKINKVVNGAFIELF